MAATDGGLRPLFRQRIKQAHWTSIESGGTASGIPDAYVMLDFGCPVWVEYKQTSAWKPKIRPFQISWHLTHSRMGGRSVIATRRQPTISPGTDELWLVDGAAIARLRDSGLRGLSQGDVLGAFTGGPSKWDWGLVREILAGSCRQAPLLDYGAGAGTPRTVDAPRAAGVSSRRR